MATPLKRAIATLTAQNTFTDWAKIRGLADISISGVSDSTVTVQRSFDGGATIKDVESFTASVEKVLEVSQQGVSYRVGIKTGNYGTDTVVCEVSQ